MKRFTQRLLELERKAREPVLDNKCNKNIFPNTDKKILKTDRSFRKNDDQLKKLRRIKSYPQLIKKTSIPLRKIKTMSAINIFPIESQSRPSSLLQYPITNSNILQEKSTPQVKEKQISFEVKTNSYNRKVEVKTKQEDTICTTRRTISSPIVTRIITTERPISPHRVSVHQQRRSSSKNLIFFIF